jgi:hypothetical protein
MADLTITEANVKLASKKGAKIAPVQAGEALAVGDVYYLDTTASNKAKKANASDTSQKVAAGIVLTAASTDGYFVGITSGPFTPGATLTKGVEYYLSSNDGKIAPYADLSSGDYIIQLFRASSTTEAILSIVQSEIQL